MGQAPSGIAEREDSKRWSILGTNCPTRSCADASSTPHRPTPTTTASGLREYFEEHVGPALQTLLDQAEDAGLIGPGTNALEMLGAIANLCIPPPGTGDTSRAHRMVALLLGGLRYDAVSPAAATD